MSRARVSIYCPYCRRYTALSLAPVRWHDDWDQESLSASWEKDGATRWWIGVCNYCNEPVLVLNDGDLVYPTPFPSPTDERIPDPIRKDLDEAKLCQTVKAWRACTVMARRALQQACIKKGADTTKKLSDQIEGLFQVHVITEDLKNWAHAVRWVGNDAAHPSPDEVTEEDAGDILGLAEKFSDVLFVAPAVADEHARKRGKSPSPG